VAENDDQNKIVADVPETQTAIAEQPDSVVVEANVVDTSNEEKVVDNATVDSLSDTTTKADKEQKEIEPQEVDVTVESVTETTDTQAVSETSKEEESTPRTRSRRSPRHIRAAGQKRRKEGDEKDDVVKPDVAEVTQDELQFDEPVVLPQAEKKSEAIVAEDKPKQNVVELIAEPDQVTNIPELKASPEAEASPASKEEVEVSAGEPEKEDISKSVKKVPTKKTPKKATSLKVEPKPAKKQSVSAPMARPMSIDEAFVDVKIGSLDDSARPEVKRSSKSAIFSSSSNAVTAPATRPGSQSE
jgi:ribonuclease E